MSSMSHRLDMGPFYTVINRTMHPLEVRVDGRTFRLEPGENPNIPSAVLPYALRQHPRHGTAGGRGEEPEYLVAIKGVTPPERSRMIAPGQEHLGAEIFDRRAFPDTRGDVQLEKIQRGAAPQGMGPTVLNQVEKVGAIEMGRD